ncbi:MAG: hypothetical protein U1F58_00300 [Burkholderiales bacterium]
MQPLAASGQAARPVSWAERAQRSCGETRGLPLLSRCGEHVFFDCTGVRLILEGARAGARARGGRLDLRAPKEEWR